MCARSPRCSSARDRRSRAELHRGLRAHILYIHPKPSNITFIIYFKIVKNIISCLKCLNSVVYMCFISNFCRRFIFSVGHFKISKLYNNKINDLPFIHDAYIIYITLCVYYHNPLCIC